MSLSDYFRKKSGAVIAAATIGLGAAGGYVGLKLVERVSPDGQIQTSSMLTTPTAHPSLSILTLTQQDQDTFEGRVSEGDRLKETGIDAKRAPRIVEFVRMIEHMEQDGLEMKKTAEDISRIKSREEGIISDTNVADILKEKEKHIKKIEARRLETAGRFINELRTSEHLSEVDYTLLVRQFDAQANVPLPAKFKNYRDGAMYNHECLLVTGLEEMLSMEEDSPEETASNIGNCMKDLFENPDRLKETKEMLAKAAGSEAKKSSDDRDIAAGLAGAAIGGLMAAPLWLRRRQPKP